MLDHVRMIALLAGLTIAITGCSRRTRLTSYSPDGHFSVQIREFCTVPDCQVKVELLGASLTPRTLGTCHDCLVNFAHIGWAADSSRAGILVSNLLGPGIEEGFDLRAGKAIPFAEVADVIRHSIATEYRLSMVDLTPYGGDPLQWGGISDDGVAGAGMTPFQKKYP